MAALRCPKCRAELAAGDIPPRCPRCGAALRCCRQCSYFDTRTLVCAHPELAESALASDADALRSCAHFLLRRLRRVKTSAVLGLSAGTWLTIFALGAIAGLLHLGLNRYAAGGASEGMHLELQLQGPGMVSQEETLEVDFTLQNTGKERARHIQLRLGGPTLKWVEPVEWDPLPRQTQKVGEALALDYGDLAGGESLQGQMVFRCRRKGQFTLRAMVSAENARRPRSAGAKIRIGD